MTIADEVREKIIAAFKTDLNQHLISNDDYPLEVTIKTVYKDCKQSLTINFNENMED